MSPCAALRQRWDCCWPWTFRLFYLNSVFSQPVYTAGKPVGVVYRTNFFSSYVNPLGLVLTQRWQWLVYLAVRLGLAAALIAFLLLLATAGRKKA